MSKECVNEIMGGLERNVRPGGVYQIVHLSGGFMKLVVGHFQASANSGEFWREPSILEFEGYYLISD